ncbi:hypothetical protein BHE74_00013295 [Ensete ventricosum]|nr:hypothetical protein BHE74_00013295 [Ensete ventricosum]
MIDVDLAATSPRPQTAGLSTWPTRRVGAGLTQAWKGQPSYDRPDKGKVARSTSLSCREDDARLVARTTDGMVMCGDMVSNEEDKGLRYERPFTARTLNHVHVLVPYNLAALVSTQTRTPALLPQPRELVVLSIKI